MFPPQIERQDMFWHISLLCMKWNPYQGCVLPFRRPDRPEHTAGIPPFSSHILETNRKRKQQQGPGTRGRHATRQQWSQSRDRYDRDAVSVSEGLPSSVLLPQEENTCPATARQHRHQPCLQVRDGLSASQLSVESSSSSVCLVHRIDFSTMQRENYPGWPIMNPRCAGRLRAASSRQPNMNK